MPRLLPRRQRRAGGKIINRPGLRLPGLKAVEHHAVCANTQKVVDFLAGSKYVQKVFYPSLENHPDHAVAVREMTRFGGVVSFEMGGFEEAKKVLNHVHL